MAEVAKTETEKPKKMVAKVNCLNTSPKKHSRQLSIHFCIVEAIKSLQTFPLFSKVCYLMVFYLYSLNSVTIIHFYTLYYFLYLSISKHFPIEIIWRIWVRNNCCWSWNDRGRGNDRLTHINLFFVKIYIWSLEQTFETFATHWNEIIHFFSYFYFSLPIAK